MNNDCTNKFIYFLNQRDEIYDSTFVRCVSFNILYLMKLGKECANLISSNEKPFIHYFISKGQLDKHKIAETCLALNNNKWEFQRAFSEITSKYILEEKFSHYNDNDYDDYIQHFGFNDLNEAKQYGENCARENAYNELGEYSYRIIYNTENTELKLFWNNNTDKMKWV